MQAPTLVALALALTLGGCSVDRRGLSGATVTGPSNSPGVAGAGGNLGSGGAMAGGQGGGGGISSSGAGGSAGASPGGDGGSAGGTAGSSAGGSGGAAGAGAAGAGGATGAGGSGAGGAAGSKGGAGGGGGSNAVDASAGGMAGTGADAGDAGTISVAGCADGTREGYTNLALHRKIAACAGAWLVPGLVATATLTPQCGRQAGNSGAAIMDGTGCSVADLCADGWHVCLGAAELTQLGETCAPAVAGSANDQVFYATRQRGNANGSCVAATNANTTNNVHGCGNFGSPENPAQTMSCDPLVPFMLEQTDCAAIVGWACGTDANSTTELDDVIKPSVGHGGVLCCHD